LSWHQAAHEPVVITGLGLITSVGRDRETVWRSVRRGQSGVKRLSGLRGIPDNTMLGATVDVDEDPPRRLKVFALSEIAALEALSDANVNFRCTNSERFACSVNSHMGDISWVDEQAGLKDPQDPAHAAWWNQFLPNTAGSELAKRYGLGGPRLTYSTACASSLVSVISAARMIEDDQCDIALAGGADAIHPLFAAGFQKMGVLADADDPKRACRPFHRHRSGFVLGEGAAMLVIERLSHAQRRGARIYAEISSYKALAEAHHVTGLNAESEALSYLISATLRKAGLDSADIGYINAHGTGTVQNDLVEMRGIRNAFGRAADDVCVSSIKSMLGHMVNAAGSVELAITVLAMRDGFAPPTLNLTDPDPELTFDCLPLVGRRNRFQHALKLSCAFGGHLVAVALSRWNDAASGFGYPSDAKAA